MRRYIQKMICICIAISLCCSLQIEVFAEEANVNIEELIVDTGTYLFETIENPVVGSVGGEWAIIGLARSKMDIPDTYFDTYYENLENYVSKNEGILHEKKYTEYSRVVLALSALGKKPEDVLGYNLLLPLGDFEKVTWQGINGAIWALIALDTMAYDIPGNTDASIQATRQMYIEDILSRQLDDGGWNLSDIGGNGVADADITGMVWQALGKYQDQEAVSLALAKSVVCMSLQQKEDGSFSSWGTSASESIVQILVGLTALGMDINDERFVKNDNTLLDKLLEYRIEGEGFSHSLEKEESDLMASEQGLYGLVAVQRAMCGESFIYDMADVIKVDLIDDTTIEIEVSKEIDPNTFTDIANNPHQEAIETLASRGVIGGKGDGIFDPSGNMTRAEFATIIVKALSLMPENTDQFTDVLESNWFSEYVGAASSAGIISGTSATTFNPYGTITRQEATSMVARSAKYCGMDIEMDETATRNVLAQFSDYIEVSNWAKGSMAFCYRENILDASVLLIDASGLMQRDEIAEMVYQMLLSAKITA